MTAPVREGQILAGKYRVDRVLGIGGMGIVVAAHHIDLDERVAIKFLLPQALENPDAIARFAREARAAVKIKSEHVARVTDVGKLDSGAPYMVMEYLDGGDLAGWLRDRGALPVQQTVDFILQACEAIAEAHALGIVHRDLKPANLFIARLPDRSFSVKVLDFGISKITLQGVGNPGAAMTKTAALMGSPLYMSPEQMTSSRDVDVRCDVWALGVILYELLTGTPPFVADTLPEVIVKVQSEPPVPLRHQRADVPSGLESVILRCLSKDRAKRYQTVEELARALVEYGTKRSRVSLERISGVTRAAGTPADPDGLPSSMDPQRKLAMSGDGTPAWWRRAAGESKSRTAVFAAGAGVILAIGVRTTLRSVAPERASTESSARPAARAVPSSKATTLGSPPAIVVTVPMETSESAAASGRPAARATEPAASAQTRSATGSGLPAKAALVTRRPLGAKPAAAPSGSQLPSSPSAPSSRHSVFDDRE